MALDYQPRHAQPFTFAQAVQLEIPVITAEIARLQNSLVHLKDTQKQLEESLKTPDPVLEEAYEENRVVISSQEERISMLRLVLEHRGLVSHDNPHYDLQTPTNPSTDGNGAQSGGAPIPPSEPQTGGASNDEESEGLYL